MRDEFIWLLKVLVAVAGARALYEASRQEGPGAATCQCKLTDPAEGGNVEPELSELPPQLRKWANRSARNYAKAQEKKWRNWDKAMFEPKP